MHSQIVFEQFQYYTYRQHIQYVSRLVSIFVYLFVPIKLAVIINTMFLPRFYISKME